MKNDKKQILKRMIKKDGAGGPGIWGGIKGLLSSSATVDKSGAVKEETMADKIRNFIPSSTVVIKKDPPMPDMSMPKNPNPSAVMDFKKFDTANKTLDMGKITTGLSPMMIKPDADTQNKINTIKNIIKPTIQVDQSQEPKIQPNFYKPRADLSVQVTPGEIDKLKAAMYGEMGLRDSDKMDLEAATIVNALLNDAGATKTPLADQLNPKRIQAINGKYYNYYKSGKARQDPDPVIQRRIAAIDKIVNQMQQGKLQDSVAGYRSYGHMYRDENGDFPLQNVTIKPYKDWNDQKIDLWRMMSTEEWGRVPKWQQKQWINKSKKERAAYIAKQQKDLAMKR